MTNNPEIIPDSILDDLAIPPNIFCIIWYKTNIGSNQFTLGLVHLCQRVCKLQCEPIYVKGKSLSVAEHKGHRSVELCEGPFFLAEIKNPTPMQMHCATSSPSQYTISLSSDTLWSTVWKNWIRANSHSRAHCRLKKPTPEHSMGNWMCSPHHRHV